MKPDYLFKIVVASFIFWNTRGLADISQLSSPADIIGGVTLNFDGYPDYTIANALFLNHGVAFARDDNGRIYLEDWASLGRTTTSPNNVLATIMDIDVDFRWATHLNVVSTAPVFALGAFFGNDQPSTDFSAIRLSAYDFAGGFLGSVEVPVNANTNVDQFIGLRSDVAFTRVRFENVSIGGTPSVYYSVVLDDLTFEPIPEPSAIWLAGVGLVGCFVALRAPRTRAGQKELEEPPVYCWLRN